MTLVIEMKKIVIKENDANQRIDKYLKKLLCNAPSNFMMINLMNLQKKKIFMI